MLITSLDCSPYTGRGCNWKVKPRCSEVSHMNVSLMDCKGKIIKSKIKELNVFDGLARKKVDHVEAGDICAVIGLEDFNIGDTIADPIEPQALPPIAIDEPTTSMLFTINDSPFFGKDGKFVPASRHIKDRLEQEPERNLAMRVESTGSADQIFSFRSWCYAFISFDRNYAKKVMNFK